MPAPTDSLRRKTDAELRYFVENPSFYQPELVEMARRELQQRGVLPAPTLAAVPYPHSGHAASHEAPASRWSKPLAASLLLLALAAGIWDLSRPSAAARRAAARPGQLSPDSLKLESVVAHPIPSFDTEKIVDAQLASVPAAEKNQAQELRQFRALSRRFWAAETQSEYLTARARAGQAGPEFADQALVARETWRDWNKAVVYRYKFGPVMAKQLDRMASVASSQQHILSLFPGLLLDKKFLTHRELNARETDVQAWMADLRKVSPITGRPYRTAVLRYHP